MKKIGWLTTCAMIMLAPGVASAQDASQGDPLGELLMQPSPEPFTFTIPAPIPEPARIDVPDEPVAKIIRLEDVDIVRPPAQSRYQPEGGQDLRDEGKTFDVACHIGEGGDMEGCEAAPNDIQDKTFIAIALDNISETVVGPLAYDGRPTAGRTLVVTARFQRTENLPAGSLALASRR